MRRLVVASMLLFFASVAPAHPTGEVEAIGFQNRYRPDCWTPMKIRLRPDSGESAFYQIQVVQRDLDEDRVVFTRTISLTGNAEGRIREQRFWMYFVPQPTDGGLPAPADGLAELQQRVKVFLADADGRQLVQLPITTTITSLSPYVSFNAPRRGTRLVLAVVDPSTAGGPVWTDYQVAYGLLENVEFVPITVDDLPDHARGLEAVDAIVWFNADPNPPTLGDEKVPIVRQYVRQGGQLVITQMPQWRLALAFGDLLPVTFPQWDNRSPPTQGTVERADAAILAGWSDGDPRARPQWEAVTGPFHVGAAQARPGAIVEQWIAWDHAPLPEQSPYLVRMLYGLGSVTWVAQDLGDRALALRGKTGWPLIWDRILGWNNRTTVPLNEQDKQRLERQYGLVATRDLGAALSDQATGFTRKTTTYVLLALVFLVVYWVIAGPGTYLYLSHRRRPDWNWFAFGLCALAAAGLTVLLVQLLLRGPPQLRHLSVARTAPDVPAVVDARLGLYIPRDGPRRVALPDAAAGADSYVTALNVHPQNLDAGSGFTAYARYVVPIVDPDAPGEVSVAFPYRSTLKKLEAHRVGDGVGGLQGVVATVPPEQGYLSGMLTNGTGAPLRDVYVAFREQRPDGPGQAWIVYLPQLETNESLDLNKLLRGKLPFVGDTAGPRQRTAAWGRAGIDWANYWSAMLRAGDLPDEAKFAVLSWFDLLPPIANSSAGMGARDRVDLLRQGVRRLDRSGAVQAGALVVLGSAEGGVPFPLSVDGARVSGQGRTVYQSVLPLVRPAPVLAPTTRPATRQSSTRQ